MMKLNNIASHALLDGTRTKNKSYAVNAVMPLKLRVPEINAGFTND